MSKLEVIKVATDGSTPEKKLFLTVLENGKIKSLHLNSTDDSLRLRNFRIETASGLINIIYQGVFNEKDTVVQLYGKRTEIDRVKRNLNLPRIFTTNFRNDLGLEKSQILRFVAKPDVNGTTFPPLFVRRVISNIY